MDHLTTFEIVLDRPVYHAGDTLSGHVVLVVEDNMRVQSEYKTYTHARAE